MGEPAIASEHLAQARAMRCWRRPSFSVIEASRETVPKAAVALKKSGAWTRFDMTRSLAVSWRGGSVARAVSASAGIGGPSFSHQECAGLAYQVDRAGDDRILIGQYGQGGPEVGFECSGSTDGLRGGEQASARCSAR